jgi:hypothetical protein
MPTWCSARWRRAAPAEATLQAQLPALRVGVRVAPLETASLACQLPGLRVSAMASYDSNVQRPRSAVRPRPGRLRISCALRSPITQCSRPRTAVAAGQYLVERSAVSRRPVCLCRPRNASPRERHALAGGLGCAADAAARWQECSRSKRRNAAGRWQEALGLRGRAATARWQECDHSKRQVRANRWQEARCLRAVERHGQGPAHLPAAREPLAGGRGAGAGRSAWGVVTPPIDPCYLPDPNLVFWDTTQGRTSFSFATGTQTVRRPSWWCPPGGSTWCSMRSRCGAWMAPGHRLSVAAAQRRCGQLDLGLERLGAGVEMAKLEPGSSGEMVQLVATVNGQDFSLVLESMSRDRQFGSSRLSIGGRGLSAVWDAPYAG